MLASCSGSSASFDDLEPSELTRDDWSLRLDTLGASRRWAFVLVDTGRGVNLTSALARDRLFGPGAESLTSYFQEVSYSRHSLSGEVFGPFTFAAEDFELCSLVGAQQMVTELLPQIQGPFDQYLWYFGSPLEGCGWEGIAELGSAARPTRHSFYSGSDGCTVLIQEPGHNYGMAHSSALRCQQDGKRVTLPGPGQAQCEHVEYGHPYDPMGDGCGHMNGVQKAYLGWLGGCNVVTAAGSGLFVLQPLEQACDGPQLLHIPLGEPRFRFGNTPGLMSGYYLEYRTGTGLDDEVPPGVYVMAAGNIKEALRSGNDNWLLDMNPESPGREDLAMTVGQSFRDPIDPGLAFTVVSADARTAVIRVERDAAAAMGPGAGLCGDDRPFDPQIPITCAGLAPEAPFGPGFAADAGLDASSDALADAGIAVPGGPDGGAGQGGGGSSGCRMSPGPTGGDGAGACWMILGVLVLLRCRRGPPGSRGPR